MVHVGAVALPMFASGAMFAVVVGMGCFLLQVLPVVGVLLVGGVLLVIVMLMVLMMHRSVLLNHFQSLLYRFPDGRSHTRPYTKEAVADVVALSYTPTPNAFEISLRHEVGGRLLR